MSHLSAWSISPKQYPRNKRIQEKIYYFVHWGILAPSAHNAQPWEAEIESNQLFLRLASNRLLSGGDPVRRECLISLGAFIANVTQAAESFGFSVALTLFPEDRMPGIDVACLTFSMTEPNREQEPDIDRLERIRSRMVNRGKFSGQLLSDKVKGAIRKLFTEKTDPQLILLEGREAIQRAANLVYEATCFAMDNPDFREELYRHLTDEKDPNPVGIPLETSSISIGKRSFQKKPGLLADQDRQSFLHSAALGIIATKTDDQESWVQTGISFENLALLLTGLGVDLSVSAGPIEAPSAHCKLKDIFDTDLRPQVFFRIGYRTVNFPHSPRLDISEIILNVS